MTSTTPTPNPASTRNDAFLDQVRELVQNLTIPKTQYQDIDPTRWEDEITPQEEDRIAVMTYTARFMITSNSGPRQRGERCQRNFEGATLPFKETWYLYRRKGDHIIPQLVFLQTIDNPPAWPDNEFMVTQFDKGTEAYTRKERRLTQNPPTSNTAEPSMPLAPIPTLPAPPATTIAEPPTTTATLPQRTIHPTSYQFQQQSIVLAEPSSPTSLEAYTTLPPADIPNGIVDANTQQKFTKIWDKEKNYTGEPYDLLDDKLRIFMSICYNIQAYDSIKQHFDTEVNHVHYYTEWTTISFNKLRADNATKSLHETPLSDEQPPGYPQMGTSWFLLPKTNEAAIAFLTESEIRTLHRRFGHPAVPRLHNLLRQAGHNDVTIDILENISRFCHHCQMHSQAPRRFKFTLKDDQEFNYEIVADVLYLGTPQRPVLHVALYYRPTAKRGPSVERKLGWQGPFKISAIDGSNVTIDTINGPQTFRSTLVQPYFRDETTIPAPAAAAADDSDIPVSDPASDSVPVSAPAPAPVPAPNPPAPRKRGRPPGSKNKPKTTFLVKKEEDAYQLAIKLRDEGIITTPGTL
ncbi:GAG-pre-integrase domain-containing protein [Hirsutella rhossiliensis]|uniref:GAG-pre-integrase domain-containing protein n=1 Tax=Hirsutella rhossiliensis TaxID=111463 RepID=A0A9P8N545_9HYPO|nr:GAG-pre-integrase domain-containing protein [Hirsutella rhossiliensis]KAH0967142.1 GAG-pre-integrase domain-containing protein [Hirsutella rhossiliensis]